MSETLSIDHKCPSCGAKVRISTSTTVIEMPLYGSIEGIAVRKVKDRYYRDNGNWSCGAEWRDGKLTATSDHEVMKKIDGLEIVAISREDWAKENKQWA